LGMTWAEPHYCGFHLIVIPVHGITIQAMN
jgi:hypothetical protein